MTRGRDDGARQGSIVIEAPTQSMTKKDPTAPYDLAKLLSVPGAEHGRLFLFSPERVLEQHSPESTPITKSSFFQRGTGDLSCNLSLPSQTTMNKRDGFTLPICWCCTSLPTTRPTTHGQGIWVADVVDLGPRRVAREAKHSSSTFVVAKG